MSDKQKRKCFVLMPFAGEFQDIYELAIKPAVESAGLSGFRADEFVGIGSILEDIIRGIYEADILIVDVSAANPNVFYELGIAHTLGKNVIVITQDDRYVPFDFRHYRYIVYKPTPSGIKQLNSDLRQLIKEVLKNQYVTSPVLHFLPQIDTVPRTELVTAEKKIKELQSALKAKESEIRTLQTGTQESQNVAVFTAELKDYLTSLTSDILKKVDGDVVKFRAEVERLRVENESLQSAQRELRRLKNMTIVNPHWKGRNIAVDERLCFLLMPFRESWSDDVWKLLERIIGKCALRCERADEKHGRVIMDDIWEGICKARIVIADLTAKNPNVTYEVGLADVLGKEVILLSQNPNDVPFDFLGLRLITYENSIGGVRKLSDELEKRLQKLLKRPDDTQSTV